MARREIEPDSSRRLATVAAIVAAGYYLGALAGLELQSTLQVSSLWPPNAFLLGVLLMTERRHWWLYLAAAIPGHVLAEAQHGVPLSIMPFQLVGNFVQAATSAFLVQSVVGPIKGFHRLREMLVFIVLAGLVVPAVVAAIAIGLFAAIDWIDSFWLTWRTRLHSNALAILTLTPLVMLAWPPAWPGTGGPAATLSARRLAEAGVLAVGLAGSGALIFLGAGAGSFPFAALLYLPIPFLLWAAVRFGVGGVCLSVLALGAALVWGSLQGGGPFAGQSPLDNALALNLFLIATAIPLLLLAVLFEEKTRAEQSIRESEEFKGALIRSSLDAIVVVDGQGRIMEFNPAAVRLFGHSRAVALGRPVTDLIVALPARDAFTHALALCATDAGNRTFGSVMELRAVRASGAEFPAEASLVRIDRAGGSIFSIEMRDATERKRAELHAQRHHRELAHANRVASMGELASSVAHELNQPLAAIMNNAQAAERLLDTAPLRLDEVRSILADIREDDLRASEILRGMRRFLRKREVARTPVELDRLVEETLKLVSNEAEARRIRLSFETGGSLPNVLGDPVHLQQVIVNLVLNGFDAMVAVPETGREMSLRTGTDGDGMVRITISDSGTGIPAEMSSRLFEAFQTTKDEGLGMGLAIARTIVEAHHGRIWAENNADAGATFYVILPASGEATA